MKKLTEDRIASLDTLRFDWDPRKKSSGQEDLLRDKTTMSKGDIRAALGYLYSNGRVQFDVHVGIDHDEPSYELSLERLVCHRSHRIWMA